jgi:hypothetical protein
VFSDWFPGAVLMPQQGEKAAIWNFFYTPELPFH